MDADWAGSILDRRSTSGGCYSLGSAMISWFSRKQSNVSLSMAEVEYIADCSSKLWSHMDLEADIRSLWLEDGHYNDSMW